MPLYCQIAKTSITTSPSVAMLLSSLNEGDDGLHILDLGCGNGRNSLAISRKQRASATLLDSDPIMIQQALQNYKLANIDEPRSMLGKIEDLCKTPDSFDNDYDIVILSYVLQHINPEHYDLIADFCKIKTKRYFAIDVYWNPSHCRIGEYVQIGSRFWYGMTPKQLVEILAPRFKIRNSRKLISRQAPYLTFSFLCEPGLDDRITSTSDDLDYELLMEQTRLRAPRLPRLQSVTTSHTSIDELPSVTNLGRVYPEILPSILAAIEKYRQNHKFATRRELAAVFLHQCRNYGFPILLDEIGRDFGIPVKELLGEALNIDPIKPLKATSYIERIVRLLDLSESVRIQAHVCLDFLKQEGRSPAVLAAASVFEACEKDGASIAQKAIADAAGVSTASIRNILFKNTSS
jgi:SAM-dependent methyltransferase